MYKVGVIGMGDMGSGLAKNLIKNNFTTFGFDLSEERMRYFANIGGNIAKSIKEIAQNVDVVFVMVMNGKQVENIIFEKDNLLDHLKNDSVIILTSTIKPKEASMIGEKIKDSKIHIIDSPVSGGYPGAQNGTLTLMCSGNNKIIEKYKIVLEAVANDIHIIGNKCGEGQTIKACLQSLQGSIFASLFEASVLAAKAGLRGQTVYDVFSTSGAGCGIVKTALENIIDRKFKKTGSHISTMHKDLSIALDMAGNEGVPLHMASTAMQLFEAAKTKYPDGDNWVITQLIEEIVGAKLER